VVYTWFPSLIFCRLTEEERRKKLKEERKERALEEKRRKVEEKLKERAKLKEEKLRLAEFLKRWNRQREDLECEDLKVCCMHFLVAHKEFRYHASSNTFLCQHLSNNSIFPLCYFRAFKDALCLAFYFCLLAFIDLNLGMSC
jgi:hypothetical protein